MSINSKIGQYEPKITWSIYFAHIEIGRENYFKN